MKTHKNYELKEGAIFISDAHENVNRSNFYEFLKKIDNKEIIGSQIFLMGDMFDFLSFTTYSVKFYSKEIALLNKISKENEIYYFEGNHDYNIAELFPNIKVFSIVKQPIIFSTKIGKSVAMAHGDIFLPFFTKYILLFLRNKTFLKFMNLLDVMLKFKITKKILKHQEAKVLYKQMDNFEEFAKTRLSKYESDCIIEGHYHQDKLIEFENKVYFNLNSYAVSQKIYKLIFKNNGLFLVNIKE